jgi:carboxyl-terminal processing protease
VASERIDMYKQLLFVAAMIVTLCAQPIPLASAQSYQYLKTFDLVWRAVKDNYVDPTFGGVNWDKVREEYMQRVFKVKSEKELHDLLRQMLGEIDQSRFEILGPEEVSRNSTRVGIGIDLQFIGGSPVIAWVEPESVAARAGIRPGFVLKQINQITVEQVFERFAKIKESTFKKNLRVTYALTEEISGKPATPVRIVYLNESDQSRESSLERGQINNSSQPGFQSKLLDKGIGYIRFNSFDTGTPKLVGDAIKSMDNPPGIIIDLRGNNGGLIAATINIARQLVSEKTLLGRLEERASKRDFDLNPGPLSYKKQIAILIDGGTAQAAEMLTAGLQESGRAVVVGERSAGDVIVSSIYPMPDAYLLKYESAIFKTPKGMRITEQGVTPDIEVKRSRGDLLKGTDPQLDAAIKHIRKVSPNK